MPAADENRAKKSSLRPAVKACRCQPPSSFGASTVPEPVAGLLQGDAVVEHAGGVNDAPQRRQRVVDVGDDAGQSSNSATSALATTTLAPAARSRASAGSLSAVAPRRPVRTSDRAPWATNQPATCRPRPPRPPVTR